MRVMLCRPCSIHRESKVGLAETELLRSLCLRQWGKVFLRRYVQHCISLAKGHFMCRHLQRRG